MEASSRTSARWMKTRQTSPPTTTLVCNNNNFGGPLGRGVLSGTAESNTAVPVGPSRPSSITHPEASPATAATVTCNYIVGWHRWARHRWALGWGNLIWYKRHRRYDTARRRGRQESWDGLGSIPVVFPLGMSGHLCPTLQGELADIGKGRSRLPRRKFTRGSRDRFGIPKPSPKGGGTSQVRAVSRERLGDWDGPMKV